MLAKKKGKYKGGKKKQVQNFDTYYSEYLNRSISKSQLARKLQISRPTLDRLIKEQQINKAWKKASKDVIYFLLAFLLQIIFIIISWDPFYTFN